MKKINYIDSIRNPIITEKATILSDQEIANIEIFVKDNLIKKVPVYAAENVKKVNVFKSLFMSLNYLIWGDV